MDVSVIGQGRRIETGTISNSLENSDTVQIPKEVIVKTVTKNEDTGKEMEHGQKNISEAEIKKSVDKLNKFLQGESTHIQYERHDILKNQFVIKIIDNDTKEVIREIPPKKILDMVAEMYKIAGILVDEKA